MFARLFVLLLALLGGCASVPSGAVLPAAAEDALDEGVRLLEARDPAAQASLERAQALAPGWIAPARLLDELLREQLRLPEALARRRAAPESAAALYLRGRLEGERGAEFYQRALELDPKCAFAHHGLGVLALRAGRSAQAEQHARRAEGFARGSWERAFFGLARARALTRTSGIAAAESALEQLLRQGGLRTRDALSIRTQSLLWRSLREAPEAVFGEALELLRHPELSDADLGQLAALLPRPAAGESEWLLALSSQPGRLREQWRARLEWLRQPGLLALSRLPPDERIPRAARFALGRTREAVDDWLAGLPKQVLDGQGLPKDPRLARMLRLARAGPSAELGEALVDCGWFDEARALAEALAGSDLTAARALDDRVLERRAELAQLVRVARVGGRLDAALKQLGLGRSPLLSLWPIGELAHPGPWFSAADEAQGLGPAGAPVGGLAERADRLGRFVLMGEVLIQPGLDAVVLPRLAVETQSGTLLGEAWSGTIVWCEGQELAPRASRKGAHIHAAALHEGFWLDIESVRRERDEWLELERRFLDQELRQAALAIAALPAGGAPAALEPALDAADRLRLAVIAERGVPTLEEFVDATATHESWHLVDRQHFLPLRRGWPRVLRQLADCGFSLRMFGEELEARAQLAALCEAREPRILLAHLLDAASGEFGKDLPHAVGYRRLLAGLLRRAVDHPRLDSARLLVQQLHLFSAQELRDLARGLARERGLARASAR